MADALDFSLRDSTGLTLTLGDPTPEVFDAHLSGPSLSVRVPVFHFGGDYLAEFFAGLARDWRGWTDERRWCSLESALGLSAVVRPGGTVVFTVELRDASRDTWRVTAELAIENGKLDDLARDARKFADFLGAAT